jgi:pilus assembly protein Flp/PilA
MGRLIRFFKNEDGAAAIEYTLLAVAVALVLLLFLPGVQEGIRNVWGAIETALKGVPIPE